MSFFLLNSFRVCADHEVCTVFFQDFSDVLVKLFELGVPFKDGQKRFTFKSTAEQEEDAE